jgi:hypothetical protein
MISQGLITDDSTVAGYTLLLLSERAQTAEPPGSPRRSRYPGDTREHMFTSEKFEI